MVTCSENLQDSIYHRQRTANDGTPASNDESRDRCRAILYAALRAIKVHERRDQAGEAIEHPWDEDAAEKPDVVVRMAHAEPKQADPADDAATDAER